MPAHCNPELAVEVRQCPLRSGARSWGPAVPTEIWSSEKKGGNERKWKDEEEVTLIKFRDLHLAGGEYQQTVTWQLGKEPYVFFSIVLFRFFSRVFVFADASVLKVGDNRAGWLGWVLLRNGQVALLATVILCLRRWEKSILSRDFVSSCGALEMTMPMFRTTRLRALSCNCISQVHECQIHVDLIWFMNLNMHLHAWVRIRAEMLMISPALQCTYCNWNEWNKGGLLYIFVMQEYHGCWARKNMPTTFTNRRTKQFPVHTSGLQSQVFFAWGVLFPKI